MGILVFFSLPKKRVGILCESCSSSIHAKHVSMTMLKACIRLEVQFGLDIPHKLHAPSFMHRLVYVSTFQASNMTSPPFCSEIQQPFSY